MIWLCRVIDGDLDFTKIHCQHRVAVHVVVHVVVHDVVHSQRAHFFCLFFANINTPSLAELALCDWFSLPEMKL